MRQININAKCSDLFAASYYKDNKYIGEYDGYVPQFMPGQHYGDYVTLQIDADTGKIINWKAPSEAQLTEVFKPVEE